MTNAFVVSGSIHFVGIGGIGMSGIAEVLHAAGYRVTGSDISENANVRRLREMGVSVVVGHAAENITDAEVVVISTAVANNNVEVLAARQSHIPVIRRADMLGELMRLKRSICVSGTHGKTTTTSLCAALLDAAGNDPTVVNGGIINAYGTNARLGKGEWFVAEADESDGSFLRLPATIAIVTNIDPEHMDHYGTFDHLIGAFGQFVHNIPFYGLAVMCSDHPVVKELYDNLTDRRKVSYGLQEGAEIRAINIKMGPEGARFDVEIDEVCPFFKHHRFEKLGWTSLKGLTLPLYGAHNVQNAVSLVAVAAELGMAEQDLRQALAHFKGVKRRFTQTGCTEGVTIIDDYAHHPVEIQAVLKAARDAHPRHVVAVVQPHRYTRLSHLFEEFVASFENADHIIACPVYAAGEEPIAGISHESLADALKKQYPAKTICLIEDAADLPSTVKRLTAPGDMVICLGAGSITQWAHALPQQLQALSSVPLTAYA